MFDLFVLQQTAQRRVRGQFDVRPAPRVQAPVAEKSRPARRAAATFVLRLLPASGR